MNDILKSLARLENENFDEAEGIDPLYLDAVHLRAFLYALDATGNESFGNSYLCSALVVGSTYSIVLKIMKLYDRQKDDYEINTIRKLWSDVKGSDEEASLITSQLDTRNTDSLFYPLKEFRDKSLAHNEQRKQITWEQIDKALLLYTRIWHMIGKHSNSIMMLPFHDFDKVSGEFDSIFSADEKRKAKSAWEEYFSKIKAAMNVPVNL